mmetsp:Transcript_22904/g.70858  ORF Transcript_22904/g.70858 Transcript_22904/m.70858 type:complete len:327 (+) Transcript_22904:796-1776(+)
MFSWRPGWWWYVLCVLEQCCRVARRTSLPRADACIVRGRRRAFSPRPDVLSGENKSWTFSLISAKTRVDAPRPQTMMLFAKLAAAGYVSYAGLAALRAAPKDDAMTCGDAVHLCGVLTLASGLGQGAYAHPTPSVHGLWPETGSYGTSDCVAPTGSTADPTSVIDCYAATGDDDAGTVSFETHEWDKHGECAGAVDAPTYLATVCDLAEKPLALMETARDAGGDLDAMQTAVEAAGYEVFSTDTYNSQLMISACAGADKEWKLVAEANFDEACGDWTRYRNRRVARVVRAAFRASIVVGGVAALAAAGARPRGFTRRAGPDEVGKV